MIKMMMMPTDATELKCSIGVYIVCVFAYMLSDPQNLQRCSSEANHKIIGYMYISSRDAHKNCRSNTP